MQAIALISQLCTPVILVAGVVIFFVRASSEKAAADRMAELGKQIGTQIEDLKTTLADINTGLRVSEAQHSALVARVNRLETPASGMFHRA